MEQKRSINKGYIPVSTEELFESLLKVTRILDLINVPYVISGGTLLGAVREGCLIPGDTDWDIEILDSSINEILENRKLFLDQGLEVIYPHFQETISIKGNEAGPRCERRIIKICDTNGNFYGDFFVQTLFSDGMLRRVNCDGKAYFNSKMTTPYWYFENRTKIMINGHYFSAPAEPVLMVKRIYGPDWKIPFERHTKKQGYNFAGAAIDANVEEGVLFALAKGWVPRYPSQKLWPMDIQYTSTAVSARWIKRHEHLEALPESFFELSDCTLDELNAKLVLYYRSELTRKEKIIAKQKKELMRLREGLMYRILKASYRFLLKRK